MYPLVVGLCSSPPPPSFFLSLLVFLCFCVLSLCIALLALLFCVCRSLFLEVPWGALLFFVCLFGISFFWWRGISTSVTLASSLYLYSFFLVLCLGGTLKLCYYLSSYCFSYLLLVFFVHPLVSPSSLSLLYFISFSGAYFCLPFSILLVSFCSAWVFFSVGVCFCFASLFFFLGCFPWLLSPFGFRFILLYFLFCFSCIFFGSVGSSYFRLWMFFGYCSFDSLISLFLVILCFSGFFSFLLLYSLGACCSFVSSVVSFSDVFV